jgi:cation:H+ antiporter
MILHVVMFLVGLVVLLKSADWMVDYAGRLAKRFGISDLIIGLTLTSVGTSVPELASSVSASLQNAPGLVVGNVVGSNVANIGLILGLSALMKPIRTDARMHDRDGVILLFVTVVFFLAVLDNGFSRWEAAMGLVLYGGYVLFLARSEKFEDRYRFGSFIAFFANLEAVEPLMGRLKKSGTPGADAPPRETPKENTAPPNQNWGRAGLEALVVVACLAGVVFGARTLVAEATWAARLWGIPENLIGLSLVAVGTSLPELMVSMAAVRKGNTAMVVGNVVGSNIANLLLVAGTAALITPLPVAEVGVVYTIPVMLFFTVALLFFVKTDWQVSRWQGALATGAYAVFMGLAFFQGWA